MKKLSQLLLLIAIPHVLSTMHSNAQNVVLGNGTLPSVFSPLNRTNDYCVYEVIYLSSQIGMSGVITAFGFQRLDGSNTDSIENVNIYMKQTLLTQLGNGNYDTTGYTLVYSGSFPNNAGAGWREVNLTWPFSYSNTSHLQVLTAKGYQPSIANTPVTPRWIYTNISPNPVRARRYYDDFAITASTQLTTTIFTSNARLTFGTTGTSEIYPGMVSVYPNPSSGTVHFASDGQHTDLKLQLLSATGALVFEKKLPGNETITLDGLQPGLYLYLLQDETSSTAVGKLLITD